MSTQLRFGQINDSDTLRIFDKHIDPTVLNWKLNQNEIVLAWDSYKLVGYLRIEYLWTKIPYIGLVIVEETERGKGIGKLLLTFLEEYLKTKGHKKLFSSSQVNEVEPQTWHRHMGFKETGIINCINEGEIGEVFFVKDLV